jgi:hypothetical protein
VDAATHRIAEVPFRALFYGITLTYLLLDFVFHGPIQQRFERLTAGSDASQRFGARQRWAATVNAKPITKDQLDLAVDLFLARRGKSWSDLPPAARKETQFAVLNTLISDELIRQWSVAQPESAPPEWIARATDTFVSGFPPGRFAELLEAHRLPEDRFRTLLASHLSQVHWLERKVAPSVEVTSEESREWFDRHAAVLTAPEVVHARHLFLSTVEEDTPEREQRVRDLHARILAGEPLASLTKDFSEDERSRDVGGDLGFFSRLRLPEDFTGPVFALAPGSVSEPFRTSIGWHVVEVIEKLPARPLGWAELRPEIDLYLANEWKLQALDELLAEQLRIPRRANVEVFSPALDLERTHASR